MIFTLNIIPQWWRGARASGSEVQHHYAHILSCMAENDCEEKVIGVSFDGTGYGTDGTIWGGELLVADCQGFTRLGSIEPFVQVGGDISAKEGWRIAVSLIWQNMGNLEKTLDTVRKLGLCTDQEAKVLVTMGTAEDQCRDFHQCRKTF